ncbi:MAG: hypothetical protein LBL45_01205 [Treponema sp.]|nr:hypothetical protein [Treponema sp.]
MPGQVTTRLGKITLHGMVMTGLQAYVSDNTTLDGDQEDGIKPTVA